MVRVLRGSRRAILATIGVVVFLLTIVWGGSDIVRATDDVTTNPSISFNPLEPVSIASGFLPQGNDLDNVVFVTVRRQSNCTERVVVVNDLGRTQTFVNLPPRPVADNCSNADIAVNTNGTQTSFTNKGYLLDIFVSRVLQISRIDIATKQITSFAQLPASEQDELDTVIRTCTRIVSIAFDPAPAGTTGGFGGDLLAACVGTSEVGNASIPAAHLYRIGVGVNGLGTAPAYVATVDDSIGRITFAPKNWRLHGFRVLVFEAENGDLIAVAPDGSKAAIEVTNNDFDAAGRVSVYAIPPRFCEFVGGVFIGTDMPNKRLIRFTDATFTGDNGDVLLVTAAGARWRLDSGSGITLENENHLVAFEDADWCSLMYSALAVKPSSVSYDNNGIATGNVSLVILSFEGPPPFAPLDPDHGLIVSTIRCGANGTEKPFTPTSSQDYNNDGILDLHGHFRAEGSGLTRGQTPVCSGHTGTGSHDAGFW